MWRLSRSCWWSVALAWCWCAGACPRGLSAASDVIGRSQVQGVPIPPPEKREAWTDPFFPFAPPLKSVDCLPPEAHTLFTLCPLLHTLPGMVAGNGGEVPRFLGFKLLAQPPFGAARQLSQSATDCTDTPPCVSWRAPPALCRALISRTTGCSISKYAFRTVSDAGIAVKAGTYRRTTVVILCHSPGQGTVETRPSSVPVPRPVSDRQDAPLVDSESHSRCSRPGGEFHFWELLRPRTTHQPNHASPATPPATGGNYRYLLDPAM